MIHRSLVLVLMAFFGILACSEGRGLSKRSFRTGLEAIGEKEKNPGERPTHARDDGNKVSDDNEGIPGYLVDPTLIEILNSRQTTTLVVNAPEGVVKTHSERGVEKVKVILWSVKLEDFLEKKFIEKDDQTLLTANAEVELNPKNDGSFIASIPDKKEVVLVVTTGQTEKGEGIILPERVSVEITAAFLERKSVVQAQKGTKAQDETLGDGKDSNETPTTGRDGAEEGQGSVQAPDEEGLREGGFTFQPLFKESLE